VSRCLPFSVAGMPTVSTTRSSASRSNSLAVPSAAAATWCTTDRPMSTFAAFSASRTLLGSVVRSSTVRAGVAPYRWSRSCFPRNAGRPFSCANVFSSAVVNPSRWNLAGASDLSRSSAEGVVAEGAAAKMERSYVARASLWDSSTKRASRSFHSPSCTPFARGTCVGSTAAAFSCAAARHTCADGAGRADGRTRARGGARGRPRDPAKVVKESAVAAAADIVRLLHHGALRKVNGDKAQFAPTRFVKRGRALWHFPGRSGVTDVHSVAPRTRVRRTRALLSPTHASAAAR
jgi:hypothetical protein